MATVRVGSARIDEMGKAEEWKSLAVLGVHASYSISSTGRLRRNSYINSRNRFVPEKIIECAVGNTGYRVYNFMVDGKSKQIKIHRLVAMAFLDNPNGYDVVNHIDGNKLNNNIENLEWCTQSHNNIHALRTGLRTNRRTERRYGESAYHYKLSDEEVEKIRWMKATSSMSNASIAKEFQIGESQVGRIIRGEQRAKGSVVIHV